MSILDTSRRPAADRLSQCQRCRPPGRAHRHHQVLRQIADAIEADFDRWPDFDKARVPPHIRPAA